MVFRKENTFQRQMSALRQQLDHEPAEDHKSAVETVEQMKHQVTEQGNRASESTGTGFSGQNRTTSQEATSMSYSPAQVPAASSAIATSSTIANGATWKGDLDSDGSVQIHGRLEGSITSREDVFIADDADVNATITAVNVVVSGLLKGTIRCTGRFEVLPQGRLHGEVHAPTIVVHEGATINGQLRMRQTEAPTEVAPSSLRRASR